MVLVIEARHNSTGRRPGVDARRLRQHLVSVGQSDAASYLSNSRDKKSARPSDSSSSIDVPTDEAEGLYARKKRLDASF